jgi:hypothetical protein
VVAATDDIRWQGINHDRQNNRKRWPMQMWASAIRSEFRTFDYDGVPLYGLPTYDSERF